ncbi:MAG: glycosyl hydrolase 108 family protein [Dongiaceae bacterium]
MPGQFGLGLAQPQAARPPAPPLAPTLAPMQQAPLAPQFRDNPAGSIGFLLQSVAAGLQGQELPIDRLRRQRQDEQATRMQQAAFALNTADMLRKVPQSQRAGFMASIGQALEGTGIDVNMLSRLGDSGESLDIFKMLLQDDPDLASIILEGSDGDMDRALKLYETMQPLVQRRRGEEFLAQTGHGGLTPDATFDRAWNLTQALEGGYDAKVYDEEGNLINIGGFDLKWFPGVDIASKTPEERAALAKENYWDPLGLDNLPPDVALVAFDTAFNQGLGPARGMIEKSGGDAETMLAMREDAFSKLADNEKFAKNREGWATRIAKVRAELGAMGSEANPLDSVPPQILSAARYSDDPRKFVTDWIAKHAGEQINPEFIDLTGPNGEMKTLNETDPQVNVLIGQGWVRKPARYFETSQERQIAEQKGGLVKRLSESAEKSVGTMQTLDQMQRLIDAGLTTGWGMDVLRELGNIATTMGLDPSIVEDLTQATDMTTFGKLAAKLVYDTVGSLGNQISNADREFIVNTVPKITDLRQANIAVMDYLRQRARANIEVAAKAIELFNAGGDPYVPYNEFLRQYGGLIGADEAQAGAGGAVEEWIRDETGKLVKKP